MVLSKFLRFATPVRTAWVAAFLVLAALLGQVLGISALRVVVQGYPVMALSTMLALLVLAWALYGAAQPVPRWRALHLGLGGVVLLAVVNGGLTLGQAWGFWQVAATQGIGGVPVLLLSSPFTALCLVLLALSVQLQLNGDERRIRYGQGAALGAVLVLFFVVLGYAFSIAVLYRASAEIGMALHTWLALLCIALGGLNMHPKVGIVGVYYAQTMGSVMLRSSVALLAVAIPGMAYVGAHLQSDGVGSTLIFALLGVTAWGVTVLVLWRTAVRLNEMEDARLEEEHRFKDLFEGTPDALLVFNSLGRVIEANAQAIKLTGYSRAQLLGRIAEDFVPHGMRAQHVARREGFAQAPYPRPMGVGLALTMVCADGTECPVDIAIRPAVYRDAKVTIISIRDQTTERSMEARLRQTAIDHAVVKESEKLFRTMADSSPLAIFMARGAQRTTEYVNPSFTKLFGYTLPDVPDVAAWWPLAYPDAGYRAHVAQEWQHLKAAAIQGRQVEDAMESRVRCKDGGEKIILWRYMEIEDSYWGFGLDVTDNRRLEAELREMAHHDTLTHLPNRRLLLDRLHQALLTCKRKNNFIALLFLDLDKFKQLNDTYGHEVGDLYLVEVAQRLRGVVREGDTVARLGGDEFVVLLEGLGAVPEAAHAYATSVAEKIRTAVAVGFVHGAMRHQGSVSIGMSLFLGEDGDPEKLLKEADAAMYAAKKNLN